MHHSTRARKQYSVGIIGLGNIAQGFDEPTDGLIRTHLKAFLRHPAFVIRALHDLNPEHSSHVLNRWGIKNQGIESNADAVLQCDVVCICTPDFTHAELVVNALAGATQVVVCEKPLALTMEQVGIIECAVKQYGRSLLVNYSRRFVPQFRAVADNIQAKEFGELLSIRAKYYGGLLHIGSHILDLLQWFVGGTISVLQGAIINHTKRIQEPQISSTFFDDSYSFGARISTPIGECSFVMEGYESKFAQPFCIEMVFENRMILIEEKNGTRLSQCIPKENILYPGYYEYESVTEGVIDPSISMQTMVNDVYTILTNDRNVYPYHSIEETKMLIELYQSITSL